MDLSSFSTATISVAVTITGLVVVFLALIGLWAIVALFGMFFSQKKPKAPQAPKQEAPKPAASQPAPSIKPAMQVEDGIGDEVIAVISAAIAAMSGGAPVAIRSVRRAREARPVWAQAGLMQNTQPF